VVVCNDVSTQGTRQFLHNRPVAHLLVPCCARGAAYSSLARLASFSVQRVAVNMTALLPQGVLGSLPVERLRCLNVGNPILCIRFQCHPALSPCIACDSRQPLFHAPSYARRQPCANSGSPASPTLINTKRE